MTLPRQETKNYIYDQYDMGRGSLEELDKLIRLVAETAVSSTYRVGYHNTTWAVTSFPHIELAVFLHKLGVRLGNYRQL